MGAASQTVAQHYFTIGSIYRVIRVVAFRGIQRLLKAVTANTGQSPNSASMLGLRRIRLTGIEPALGCDAGPTLNRWVGLHCVYQVHPIDSAGGCVFHLDRNVNIRYQC